MAMVKKAAKTGHGYMPKKKPTSLMEWSSKPINYDSRQTLEKYENENSKNINPEKNVNPESMNRESMKSYYAVVEKVKS